MERGPRGFEGSRNQAGARCSTRRWIPRHHVMAPTMSARPAHSVRRNTRLCSSGDGEGRGDNWV